MMAVILGLVLFAGAIAVSWAWAVLRKASITTIRGQAPGEFAELSDGVTHYRWFGPEGGPLVVLVHGLTTPSPVFEAIASKLGDHGARVLTYDLFGRGYSDRPWGRYDEARYTRQLLDLLADQGVKGSFVLAGYSMGGAIVAAFAAKHTDKVRGLVLIAPAGFKHNADQFSKIVRAVPVLGDWAMEVFGARGLEQVAEAARQAPSQVPGIGDIMAQELKHRGYLRAVLASLRGLLGADLAASHKVLADRKLNVLAVWGAQDDVIPISAKAISQARIPQADHLVIDAADHGVAFSHGAEIADAMMRKFHVSD